MPACFVIHNACKRVERGTVPLEAIVKDFEGGPDNVRYVSPFILALHMLIDKRIKK